MRAETEIAIVSRLRGFFGPSVRRIEAVGDSDIGEAFRQLLLMPPTVLVFNETCDYVTSTMGSARTFKCDAVWDLMVNAKNLRGDKAGREGGPIVAGAYTIIEGINRVLADDSLGLAIYPFAPVSLRPQRLEISGQTQVVFHYRWKCGWEERRSETEPDLYRIHAAYALDNGGEAEDLVTVSAPPAP
jgi:phage gp37-like protein